MAKAPFTLIDCSVVHGIAMRHGWDLEAATELYGLPREGWLDLSTGINPRPYPVGDLNRLRDRIELAPSAAALAELLAAARDAYEVPKDVAIAAAPGAAILIRALPELIAGTAVLLETSCDAHRKSWTGLGRLTESPSLHGLAATPAVSAILVNPNDPDGRLVTSREILTLARSREPGSLVVVDEAFAEAEPGASVAPHLRAGDPVLVLKSLGPFFGLAGLGLGFAIGEERSAERLRSAIGGAALSGIALAVGHIALADTAWRVETRHWLGNQAQSLDGVLKAGGLEPAGGTRLFRIARSADAPGVHEKLARRGIWTRLVRDGPGLIRFGLPAGSEGLSRLADALAGR
jgi:cobalamin biosynthetic protein CobC